MPASPRPQPAEITRLLLAWGDGDPDAAERLMPLVYEELRRMARAYVRQGRGDRTLRRTALVHEYVSEAAVAKNPDYVAHRFNFAAAVRQLGLVQRDRGAIGEAIRAFRRSIAIFESLPGDQRDPKQSLATAADLGLALATDARRSGTRNAWATARTALRQALEGWQAYQRGAGAREDHHRDIEALSSALQEAERMAGDPRAP